MHLRAFRSGIFLCLCSSFSAAVIVKTPSPNPSLPTLRQLTKNAGYIFSGTVLSVERVQPNSQNEVASVRITFRVDQAVHGVASRQILTIREWAGLWDSGDRYRRGEQVLLFLYQPSKLGLTSPVNGDYGRFKLNNNGKIMLNAARLAALQTNVNPPPTSGGTISISSRDLVRAIPRGKE